MHPPPYTYNDSRLTYNESCFYYTGGYDQVCLVIGFNTKRRVGAGAGQSRRKQENLNQEQPTWVDVAVHSTLVEVNNSEFKDFVATTQVAKEELSPGEISLLALRAMTESSNVSISVNEVLLKESSLNSSDPTETAGIIVTAEPLLTTHKDKLIPLKDSPRDDQSLRTSFIIKKKESKPTIGKQEGHRETIAAEINVKKEQIEHDNDVNFKAALIVKKSLGN